MSKLSTNTTNLQSILETINNLPEAGSGGISLPTLSSPAAEEEVFEGSEYIDQSGNKKTGTFTIEEEITTQDNLIAQIQSALSGKVSGENSGKPEQSKEIPITENGEYEILPDEGYTLSNVTITVNVEGANIDDFGAKYQRVEYIESAEAGTYPYIITDFIADNTCGIEVVASFSSMVDRIPMGSRNDGNATRFYCAYPLSTSSCYFGFNSGSSISCALSVNTQYRLQTNFLNCRLINIYDANGIRKGGTTISQTLVQQNCPVAIFGYNRGDTNVVSSKREYKLYSARCSRGHEVVREYIPCYRKSDGVIGLYEKFTKQFLTNASDTGSFAKGPDITE